MVERRLPQDEIAASLRAGRELGPDYDEVIVSALMERLDRAVDERTTACLRANGQRIAAEQGNRYGARAMVTVMSLIFAVPLSAIAGGTAGAAGLLLTWVGIVLVNLVVFFSTRGN